ncbi:hypothetical protein [Lactobacillus iners]|jgi:hypothetical protein|uniref:Uncharacterized protein n=2 Tax=Lactobacillus iners TaxID=147802 RepID=A0A6G7BLX3_9LACO|nr:hypothetical protein [Lactobacillus iners]MCT7792825.1 hypothetical protein [Lactobacillus iners]MDK8757853.1 hypothetical protein [Lactobacillus iners]QIH24471.1 hypothetical protein G6Z83_07050 [Lactobacillus iners]QIH25809.1 hypothetical protein G6Z84_07180 [Lactobacillus iners]QIH28327.1 hypothetical protein G6Z86_07050 [Lactobacillus iners]
MKGEIFMDKNELIYNPTEKDFDCLHFAMYLGNTYVKYKKLNNQSLNKEDQLVCNVLLDIIKQFNKEFS